VTSSTTTLRSGWFVAQARACVVTMKGRTALPDARNQVDRMHLHRLFY
jgi:hypothetical protein